MPWEGSLLRPVENEHRSSWVVTSRTPSARVTNLICSIRQTAADNSRGNSARQTAKLMANGQPQTLNNSPTSPHSPPLAWCVRALRFLTLVSKVVLSDTAVWGCDCVGWVVRVTPTNPVHRERIRGRIKTTAPTGMCHIQMGALLSPRQSFGAMSHSRNPRWGRGLREGVIFFTPRHKAAERRSPWLTHGEEKGLSNHNNNRHHPAVSTVAANRDSSHNQYSNTESDHSSRWDNIAVESAVCAEHANCSVLLITSISQLVMGQILAGLFTWLSPLTRPAGAWLYCLVQSWMSCVVCW